MKRVHRFLARSFLTGMLICVASPGFAENIDDEIRRLGVFSEVYHLIGRSYLDPMSNEELIDAAVNGMVSQLDSYSTLLRKEDVEIIESVSMGKMVGIGLNVQVIKDRYTVTKVYRSTPASRAGIQPGDILVSINGTRIDSLGSASLSRYIKGEIGSVLNLEFYHPHAPETVLSKSIKRERFQVDSVEGFEVGPEILVLQIHEFQKKTPQEIRSFLSRKPYKAVILDLRDNFGGLFLSGVETAELFLPVGIIVETRDQRGLLKQRYVSRESREIREKTLVVLINRFSASSAEIVAGALKDRHQGILVGEKSFGKGIAQTIFQVSEDLYLKLTTSRFYAPSGESYHNIGITPDYLLPDTARTSRYQSTDNIFQKALEIVKSQLEDGPSRSAALRENGAQSMGF